jgi:hypothetical protein
MKNCKSILDVFIWYRFFVRLIMVLTNVISLGSTSIIKYEIIYHKKSLDLVTGNFLLRVITLLSDLSSDTEPSGLFQPRLTGQVVFCSHKEFTAFCLSVKSSFQFKEITGTSLLLIFTSLQICVAVSLTKRLCGIQCQLLFNRLTVTIFHTHVKCAVA